MSVLLLDNFNVTFDPGLFYQNNVSLNFICSGMVSSLSLFNIQS